MTHKPLRIGLIGAGSIAAWHVEGIRAAGDTVAAIAAGSAASAEAAAARLAVVRACPDWRSLVTAGDLDAVIVATPDLTHEEIALAAIAAGRPVMVQKPLAISSAAALRIVAAGRASGVPVFTSYMHRHFPEIRAWQQMTAGGAEPFGPVLSVRLRNATPGPDRDGWYFDAARSGGVIAQLGIHGIDLLGHLFGPIASVAAMTALRRHERRLADGRVIHATADDHAMAIYRTSAGVIISHEMCFAEVGGTDRFALEITCEKAKLAFRGPHGALVVNEGQGWKPVAVDGEEAGTALHRLWSAMVRGEIPHDGSDLAGLQGLLVAEAINEAATRGQSVNVPQADSLLAAG